MQFRKFTFILSLIGFLVLSSSALALQSGDFTYTVKNNTITINGYTGSGGAVIVPSTIEGMAVVSFGCEAFYNQAKITSITIPDSVTFFDNSIFKGCTGLTSITLPSSLTDIGNWAFQDCSSLTSITIPASVTFIGLSAFTPCPGLTGIDVEEGNPNYSSQDGVLYDKDKTTLIQCPANKSGVFTIPHSVTKITIYAFYECARLTGVSIPDSVTDIEGQAFMQCTGLTGITIPPSVMSIGLQAFSRCTGLTGITLPSSITSMGNQAFLGCTGLTSITISSGVTNISDYAFKGCTGLISVTIPDSITSIGDEAFNGCSGLTGANFNGNAPEMGSGVFDLCATTFTVYHTAGATGFTNPWHGYTTKADSLCPAQKALGENDPKLENLRSFRDGILANNAIGRRIIQMYYNNSDTINAALESSPELKVFTRRFLELIAPGMPQPRPHRP